MNRKKDKISLVIVSLLSLTLGSALAPVVPVQGQIPSSAMVELVWKMPDCFSGLHDIPSMPDGSVFTVCLIIRDVDDMDSWDATLNYYTKVLDILGASYMGCLHSVSPNVIQRDPSLIDDIGDGIRGQVGLGEAYAILPARGFTGSCILAEVVFAVATGAFANGWSTKIHITRFLYSSVTDSFPVPRIPGLVIDATYESSSIRYVDLLASPIRKRCVIENHHYRWSLSRDGADGVLSFDCTLVAYGDAYPVVARVKVTIIDQTINAIFPAYLSGEVQFFSKGQSAPVRVDKGAQSDDNNDGIIDLQMGHSYLVNADAIYDCTGTTFLDCQGQNDRVFTYTVKT